MNLSLIFRKKISFPHVLVIQLLLDGFEIPLFSLLCEFIIYMYLFGPFSNVISIVIWKRNEKRREEKKRKAI